MLTHRPIPDELTAAWLAPLGDPGVRADVTATLRAIDKRDTLRAAEGLRARPLPVLLAWAPDDRIFPLRFAERLAAMIPGARLELVADSRAFVPEDQPTRLAELVGSFLDEDASADAGDRSEPEVREGALEGADDRGRRPGARNRVG
jgi:pimeloyl-ACP methyl ester carboxylesterase